MAVDHVERGLPFGLAIGAVQFTLHDQARSVLDQGVADEAQHSAATLNICFK